MDRSNFRQGPGRIQVCFQSHRVALLTRTRRERVCSYHLCKTKQKSNLMRPVRHNKPGEKSNNLQRTECGTLAISSAGFSLSPDTHNNEEMSNTMVRHLRWSRRRLLSCSASRPRLQIWTLLQCGSGQVCLTSAGITRGSQWFCERSGSIVPMTCLISLTRVISRTT